MIDTLLENEVTVSPNRVDSHADFSSIQDAIDYVAVRASLSNPWTIRLLPGIYEIKDELDATDTTGIRIVGAGRDSTIIRMVAGGSYYGTGSGNQDVINATGADGLFLSHLWLDGLTNAAANFIGGVLSGMRVDGANVVLDSVRISAPSYSTWVVLGTAGKLVEIFNSKFDCGSGMIIGRETWHIFSSELRATRTSTQFDSAGTPPNPISGLTSFSSGEVQIWGCHIHSEDSTTAPGPGLGVACFRLSGTGSTLNFEVLGTTCHVKVTANYAGDIRTALLQGAGRFSFIGNNFLIDATPASSATTVGVFGGGGNASMAVHLRGNNVQQNNPTTPSAATLIGFWSTNGAISGTVSISGQDASDVGFLAAPSTFSGTDMTRTSGSATLASGVARVLLITDAGNSAVTDAVFNPASVSVTTATGDFTTVFRAGDFVRLSTDTDSTWTRIATVTTTTLTLAENYRGTSNTGTARRATRTNQTQPNATYRAAVTAAITGETFSVTAKHASGFTITSSNGASTATVDWILLR